MSRFDMPRMRVEEDESRGTPPPKEELDPKSEVQKKALLEAEAKFGEFFRGLEATLNAYFGSGNVKFTVRPGGWYVDLKEIRVNADPTFFLDRGYSKSEALFAAFHEAEHFRDMVENPSAYEGLRERVESKKEVHKAYPRALHRLFNCLDDVLVNRAVMARWKDGRTAKDSLYPKLFPSADFRGEEGAPTPRHQQFMYAILREAMMPGEPCQVDPEVQAALDWCRKFFGKDLSRLLSADAMGHARPVEFPGMDSLHRFAAIEAMVEPVFEPFSRQDLTDRKTPPKKEKGEPEAGEPGEPGDAPFDDPFDDAISDPIPWDQAIDEAKKINASIKDKEKKDFAEIMGVEQREYEAYMRDVEKVAPHIDQLSEVFDKVIQRRISQRRVLRKRVSEGVMLDPRMAATAMAEIKAGHADPVAMLDYESKNVIRKQPNRIEFTVICDGSSSMQGAKAVLQRRLAILAMEAFAKFRDRIFEANQEGHAAINLEVLSEVRMFGTKDALLKPLSQELTFEQRVHVRKQLAGALTGNTNEGPTFEAIEREEFADEDRIAALRKGDTKKIILFLTDGQSGDVAALRNHIARLSALATPFEGSVGSLVIAGLGFDNGKDVVTNYAPHGYYAENLEQVISIFEKFIESILEEV